MVLLNSQGQQNHLGWLNLYLIIPYDEKGPKLEKQLQTESKIFLVMTPTVIFF
jgi:hypothetical protein